MIEVAGHDELHLVSFRAREKLYGVDIMQVHRVLIPDALVEIPGVDPPVAGMIDLGGTLVAVVQLHDLLAPGGGRGARGACGEIPRRVVVVHVADGLLALAVEDVGERFKLSRAELLPRPEQVKRDLIVGAFYQDGELGLLLDPGLLRCASLESPR